MLNRRQFGLLLGSSATALVASRLAGLCAGQTQGGRRRRRPWRCDGCEIHRQRERQCAIEVTLVEPTKQFTTCFHSNLHLGGFKPLEANHAHL